MRRSMLAAFMMLIASPACAQELRFSCKGPEDVRATALEWLNAASASPATRDADRAAGEKAYQAAMAVHAQVMAGQDAGPIYQGSRRFLALAAAAKSDRTRALFERAAREQLFRLDMEAAVQRQSWAAGLSDNAASYAFSLIGPVLGCSVDQENTAWLKAQIAKDGWFTISRDGADADSAAWLMTQHADQDLPFQKQILAVLEPLVPRHETNPRNFAYIYDRVAVNEQRPQRYGTQGMCTDAGTWQPRPTEAPETLDARRAGVGLGPEAAYAALFHCPKLQAH